MTDGRPSLGPPPIGLPQISVPSMTRTSVGPSRGVKAPIASTKKKLTDHAAGPAIAAVAGAAIALPILSATTQTVTRSHNRQEPPPLEYQALNFPPAQAAPMTAQKVEMRPIGRDPLTACIESAPEGSVISVPAGTYRESITVKKQLHFVANGAVTIASDTVTDTVKGLTELCTFEGFTFTQDESQSASALIIESGTCVFRRCVFKSNHTVTIIVKNDAKLYLMNCQVESADTTAMMVNNESTVVCEETTFSAPKTNAVLVRGKSKSRWHKCSVTQCGRNAFHFSESCQFLFENATISKPIEIIALTNFGMLKNCSVEGDNLKIGQSATPYLLGCRFDKVSLECKDTCGVRVIGTTFSNQPEQPGILVYGDATVALNDCEFRSVRAGAAAAVYKSGTLRVYDSRFIDLSGAGILGFGPTAELLIERSVFGNIANSAVVVHTGTEVTIKESLVDRVGGVGFLFRKSGKIEIGRSKCCNCGLSGVEVNGCNGVNVDHCIFEANSQCGFVSISSQQVKISDSDFIRNRMTGLDIRDCDSCVVAQSIYVDNIGGGIAVRNQSRVDIEGGGIGNNQQYGLASYQNSTVNMRDTKISDNENLAILATDGSDVTANTCEVKHHDTVAVVAEGQGTRLALRRCELSDNTVGVQCVDNANLIVEDSQLQSNGVHMEIYDRGVADVIASKFEASDNGVGVSIAQGGKATFSNDCRFYDEAKTAIANAGECNISRCTVTDCGTCGIYWYGKDAIGEIKDSSISGNGPCGIQIMDGQCTVVGNTIESHSAFGIHVQPTATLRESANQFSQNSMAEVNHEE